MHRCRRSHVVRRRSAVRSLTTSARREHRHPRPQLLRHSAKTPACVPRPSQDSLDAWSRARGLARTGEGRAERLAITPEQQRSRQETDAALMPPSPPPTPPPSPSPSPPPSPSLPEPAQRLCSTPARRHRRSPRSPRSPRTRRKGRSPLAASRIPPTSTTTTPALPMPMPMPMPTTIRRRRPDDVERPC